MEHDAIRLSKKNDCCNKLNSEKKESKLHLMLLLFWINGVVGKKSKEDWGKWKRKQKEKKLLGNIQKLLLKL